MMCALLAVPAASGTARATWSDHADLIYDTAYTLDQGEFEVGVFSPLTYGVNDRVQLSMHPIFLLILSPHVGLRWQVTPTGPWGVALNVEGTWSFLEPVDSEGREAIGNDCDDCGFPGSLHAWPIFSWEASPGLLLSGGVGPRFDFLDLRHENTALVTHSSVQWLIDPDNLLMMHATFDTRPWENELDGGIRDSVIQVTYAHAWGMLHLALGVAIGDFDIIFEQGTVSGAGTSSGTTTVSDGEVATWPVFPVIDLFFRL